MAAEGDDLVFEVWLDNASEQTLSVQYATTEHTTGSNPATADDYTVIALTPLTFTPSTTA